MLKRKPPSEREVREQIARVTVQVRAYKEKARKALRDALAPALPK
jgi:hypothetical protein